MKHELRMSPANAMFQLIKVKSDPRLWDDDDLKQFHVIRERWLAQKNKLPKPRFRHHTKKGHGDKK